MCAALILKVVSVKNSFATMQDKRIVHTGNLKDIKPGDYLEVYADIAVNKVDQKDAQSINNARK
jgi:hypothetical protein